MERGLKPADLRRLDRFNQNYKLLVQDNTTRERMMVDLDRHLALASLADNRALLRSLEAVFERLILKIRTGGYRTVRAEEALCEHVEMMKALCKKTRPSACWPNTSYALAGGWLGT